MSSISDALMSLRPGAEWTLNGDDVEGIIWHTPDVEPVTLAEVEAEMLRLDAYWAAEKEAKVAAKASAIAKLAALGLTEEEAAALVGQ